MQEETQVVCFSGGHSSALAAIETVRKYGKENVILLNHDISSHVEHQDIKRFKREIADYLDLDITYANIDNFEHNTPLNVCLGLGSFINPSTQQALCTTKLKTEPFQRYLKENYPVADVSNPKKDLKIIYGFDMLEQHRIQRRIGVMATQGYYTDFPLALWDRTIESTNEIGVAPPRTYKVFKHANCIGCLKAGRQHWYVVYCLRPDIFAEAIKAEQEIGYSIIKGAFLEELVPKFKEMQSMGICPNDKEQAQSFWAKVDQYCPEQMTFLPCDCALF